MSNAKLSPPRILLQVNGSIAAFKAVAFASKLVQAGFDVEVILSAGATQFVGAASFEGLTRKKVHAGVFDQGQMMAHIDLERWADLIVTYPASANFIAKIANGLADDLSSTLFLAHEFKKPYWIAPAMNQAMWNHPAVKTNIEKLRGMNVTILSPESGSLACGEIGQGRLIEPEMMFQKVSAYFLWASASLHTNPLKGRILVTAGGTTEPIDPVRSITNVSTGRTGHSIARALEGAGYDVHLVQSRRSPFQSGVKQVSTYESSDDLAELLQAELSQNHYDVVIHSAAVADFKAEQVAPQKISSSGELNLKLVPTPKIVKQLRSWSKNKNLKLISFKLTTDSNPELSSYDSEWVIHNDLKNVHETNHHGVLYRRNASGQYELQKQFQTKSELNEMVLSLIQKGGAK